MVENSLSIENHFNSQLIDTWSLSLKALAKGQRINRKGRLSFDSDNPCIFRLKCGSILSTEVTKKNNLLLASRQTGLTRSEILLPSPWSIGLSRSETPLPITDGAGINVVDNDRSSISLTMHCLCLCGSQRRKSAKGFDFFLFLFAKGDKRGENFPVSLKARRNLSGKG